VRSSKVLHYVADSV